MRYIWSVFAVLLFASGPACSAELKVTALYSHPQNAEEFDKYYYGKHMPMVYAVKDIKKIEVARPRARPNGEPSAYYLVTELWFDSPEVFSTVTATPEWKAIAADVANFAPAGLATVLVSVVEPKR